MPISPVLRKQRQDRMAILGSGAAMAIQKDSE